MQLPRRFRTHFIASISALLAVTLPGVSGTAARAQDAGSIASGDAPNHLVPVHLWVAGRTLPLRTSPVTDSKETYVPLTALAAVGADFRLLLGGNGVHVTARSNREQDIPLVRIKSVAMLPLSTLAKVLDASIGTSDQWPGDRPTFRSADTVYLLAHVTGARFENGLLHVRTSFPVPFHTRMLAEVKPVRGYVDCVGAELSDSFRPSPATGGQGVVTRLRAAQNSPTIARIVVELADGAQLQTGDSGASQELTVTTIGGRAIASGSSGPQRIASTQSPPVPRPLQSGSEAASDTSGRTPFRTDTADRGSSDSERAPANTSGDASRELPAQDPNSSAGTTYDHPGPRPIEVRGIDIALNSPFILRFEVMTGARVRPIVRYSPGTTQMLVDIPNAQLALPDGDERERALTHPLISGVRMETIQGSGAPTTRLTLDTARILGYSVNVEQGSFSLELRVPRNATGALADKLIVVDAGHGGSATGARTAGICEKDCTLGIALRLRAELEACGARVIMTRTNDIDVSLNERCRMGNELGADLFLSIHNDSNERSNSASGTSTYFHGSESSSRALATCVQHAVMAITGLPSRGVLSDTVMYNSGFAVLRGSSMPAVLCEVAYINNQTDRRKLVDAQFQQRVARAMCDGLRSYVEGSPRRPAPAFARPMPAETPSGSGDTASGSRGS